MNRLNLSAEDTARVLARIRDRAGGRQRRPHTGRHRRPEKTKTAEDDVREEDGVRDGDDVIGEDDVRDEDGVRDAVDVRDEDDIRDEDGVVIDEKQVEKQWTEFARWRKKRRRQKKLRKRILNDVLRELGIVLKKKTRQNESCALPTDLLVKE